MAVGSSAVRAGRAFVELFADDSALTRTLNGLKSKLASFAGVASAAGVGRETGAVAAGAIRGGGPFGEIPDRIGRSVGNRILGGIAGGFALHAVDRSLRDLSDRLRASAASGEAFGFLDLGITLGESMAEGLKSVPIAGALGDLLSQGIDYVTGGTIAQEAAQKASREVAERRNAAIGQASDALQRLQAQRRDAGDPLAQRRTAFESGTVAPLADRMREAGVAFEEITKRTDALREEFETLIGEEEARRQREAAYRERAQRRGEIFDTIARLRDELEELGRSAVEVTAIRLRRLGASEEEIGEATSLVRRQEALRSAESRRRRRLDELTEFLSRRESARAPDQSAVGTFSGDAAGRLGSGSALTRIVTAVEKAPTAEQIQLLYSALKLLHPALG